METDDFTYLVERSTAEFQAAQRAASITAARPHYRLAVHYLEKAEELKRKMRS